MKKYEFMKSSSIQKLQAKGYVFLRMRESKDGRCCIYSSRSFGSWEKCKNLKFDNWHEMRDYYTELLRDKSNMYISDTHISLTLYKLIPAGYTCVEQTGCCLFVHSDRTSDSIGDEVRYDTIKQATARLKELEERENFIVL